MKSRTDYLLDTNVLIVASAAGELDPQYSDVPVDSSDVERVFNWLQGFKDSESRLVLDNYFKIHGEYHNKLNVQHYGLLVVQRKLEESLYRTVPVDYDSSGYAVVPESLAIIDNSDKKFVAAALNDPEVIAIVNATDGDWREQAAVLAPHRIQVLELLA